MTEANTKPVSDPDAMEVAPGAEHEVLEGWIQPWHEEELAKRWSRPLDIAAT